MIKKSSFLILFMYFLYPFQTYASNFVCIIPADKNEAKEKARKLFKMGIIHAKQGNTTKVIQYFDCVLKLVPESANSRYQYATALDKLGQYSRARIEYKLFLAAAPSNHPKISYVKARISTIAKLKDKPLPKEFTKNEAKQTTLELKKATLEFKKIAQQQKLKEMELKKQLEELKKEKSKEEFEKTKKQLILEFKQKEKLNLKKLENKIQRLAQLQELTKKQLEVARKGGVVSKKIHYTYKDNITRKIGSTILGSGLLIGIITGAAAIYSGILYSSINNAINDDYKNIEKKSKVVYYWKSEDTRDDINLLETTKNIVIYSGVTASACMLIGAILYFSGKTDKIIVEDSIIVKNQNQYSWSILPSFYKHGSGINFSFKW